MRFRSIQVLRCVAALAVVLCHALDMPVGAAGVDLFFVISGFIIATVAPGRDPKTFLIARFRRIFPIYWLALLPWLAIAYLGGVLSPQRLMASVTLWPIYDDFYRPALLAGWSLSYELVFYIAAAAALALGPRLIVSAFAVFCAASFVLPLPIFEFLGNVIIFEFLAGVLIARLRPKLNAFWLIPAFALLALSPDLSEIVTTQAVERLFWWGVPAILIFAVALSYEDAFKSRLFNAPVFMGDASYSIYLFHQLILIFLMQGVGGAILACAFGALMYVLLERRLILPQQRRSVAGAV